jgi:aerobic carbon-monoxide dehydrogenase medium subunit
MMVAVAFDYLAAGSYAEAVARLAEYGDEAKIVAGGQSLLPMLNLRLARPSVLIDINAADPRQPAAEDGMLRLPATTRHRVLLEHPLVRRHCPLLAGAVRHVGNVRVRNRGTIGGSLAHADPTSEIGSCALALGAQVVARGPSGDRTIAADDLFVTYLTTALAESEVITDVLVPVARLRQGWAFHEMVRRTSDFAIVAVAAWLELATGSDAVAAARVALAGVADRVVLVPPDTVSTLLGGVPGDAEFQGAAAAIARTVDPASDVHASAGYRRRLSEVLTTRALRDAYYRAQGAAACAN